MKAMAASLGPLAVSASSAVRNERLPLGTAASMREPQVRSAKADSRSLAGDSLMPSLLSAPAILSQYRAAAAGSREYADQPARCLPAGRPPRASRQRRRN